MPGPIPLPLLTPTEVSFRTRCSLRWVARRDGARNIPFIEPLTDAASVTALTPRIKIAGAEAQDQARARWSALHDEIAPSRLQLRDATDGLADVSTRIATLQDDDVDPGAATLDAEELRRLLRSREALQHAIARCDATIEQRSTAAVLAIEHIYARANLLVSIYWHALRRHHRHRDALAAEPERLVVPSWVDPDLMTPMPRPEDPSTPVNLTERKRRAKN